ncbi:unnamed protein product [Oikopleura dioica]|uniref:Uncharacterized protein n=1 Tax=Oikopleura dioica TaxID=34765 RepID=E4WQQ0_OIKDI|nr:unnamed protein product [Oikopleura dioica]
MTFWRLIFCQKQKQEKRLQELEKSGKPSTPEKRLKARSQTVDVEPTFNGKACVDEPAPAAQEHLPQVTKIESRSADCPQKRDDANPSQSTEEEATAGDSTGDQNPSPSTLRREEKRKRENRKPSIHLHIKNKPTIEEIEAKIKDVEKQITGKDPIEIKDENKEETKENQIVKKDEPLIDGKFERIKARDTCVPEKETAEPEKFFPRVGSLRSLKRREEILEKIRKKKDLEAEENRRRSAPAQIGSPIQRTNDTKISSEIPEAQPRSPRPQVPPPEKPAEFKVPSPLPSPPIPPEKKSIDTIQGRVQVVSSRGLTSHIVMN